MLNGRALKLTRCCRPFRPEGGAYNTHQHS
jgi:hypothetical protein